MQTWLYALTRQSLVNNFRKSLLLATPVYKLGKNLCLSLLINLGTSHIFATKY